MRRFIATTIAGLALLAAAAPAQASTDWSYCKTSRTGSEIWSAYDCEYALDAFHQVRRYQRRHGGIQSGQRFRVYLADYGFHVRCRAYAFASDAFRVNYRDRDGAASRFDWGLR